MDLFLVLLLGGLLDITEEHTSLQLHTQVKLSNFFTLIVYTVKCPISMIFAHQLMHQICSIDLALLKGLFYVAEEHTGQQY